MSDQLKPCPFCGSQPEETARKEGLVWCPVCPVGRTADQWNHRPTESDASRSAAGSERERCIEALKWKVCPDTTSYGAAPYAEIVRQCWEAIRALPDDPA